MMQEVVNVQLAPRSTQMTLVATFAGLALLLAGIGIHGLLSFTVGRRLPEFGLRIALGARSRQILSMVLKEGIALVGIGAACGLVLSYFTAGTLQALLAGVPPFDPAIILVAVLTALLMSLSGSLLPALRAVRTDPTRAMRMD
jgi:ABC-type antimicrobial peptide transport system permease subunit